MSGSPTGMMSNMSLVPMSPGDETFAFPDHPSAPRPASLQASHASNTSQTGQSYNEPFGQMSASSRSIYESQNAQERAPGKAKPAPRFSLFAPNQHHTQSNDQDGADDNERENHDRDNGDGDGDETVHYPTRVSSAERDDKLRESLYELRQMNEVFDGFLGALESARGHNQVS